MIEKLTLEELLDICKAADLDVVLEDGYIELKLDDENSATLMMNDDEDRVSFCFIPNIEVSTDDPDDLMLCNAINAAFFGDDTLPSLLACIDVYDEDTEEEAMMLRSALSLVGGITKDGLLHFIEECIDAMNIVFTIIDGGEDEIEGDEE